MHNPFPYSDTNKRYHTFDYFLRHRFGGKVAKVSLDAGFTCPNIDGSKGVCGCTYCSAKGSGDFAGDKNLPLRDQFEQVRQMMDRKWPGTRYIPYFQAHTNTYAPLPVPQKVVEGVVALVGIRIGAGIVHGYLSSVPASSSTKMVTSGCRRRMLAGTFGVMGP